MLRDFINTLAAAVITVESIRVVIGSLNAQFGKQIIEVRTVALGVHRVVNRERHQVAVLVVKGDLLGRKPLRVRSRDRLKREIDSHASTLPGSGCFANGLTGQNPRLIIQSG